MSTDDLKKLLEQAKQEPKTEIKYERQTDVHNFIQKYNIKDGEAKVPAGMIYQKYKDYKKRQNLTPKVAFFTIFQEIFKKYITENEVGYLLDPEPFDLSDEGMFKFHRRAYLEKKAKERKKRSKKSGTKTSIQSKKKS